MGTFRFLASYAHADAKADNLLQRFYTDLLANIKRTILTTEEGFFDEASIPVGGSWPRNLEGALRTAKCMLSFYSPEYFNSEYCGKEVKALQLRAEQYKRAHPGNDPAVLLGVLWESQLIVGAMIPPCLRTIQYGVPHFGDDLNRTAELHKMVAQFGLRNVMQKMNAGSVEYSVAYLDIIERYAAHIRQVTTRFDLSACDFSGALKDVQHDFPIERQPVQAAAPSTGSYGKGPKFVRVLFIVGNPGTFAVLQERKNIACYDNDPRLWRPFFPGIDDYIGNIVNTAVASEKLIADWVSTATAPDPATLLQIVRQAMADNNVLVVIIDPWSALLPDLQASLKVLDDHRLAYGAMFLPWNEGDQETVDHTKTLQAQLEHLFYAMSAENESLFSDIVFHSPMDLENQLRTKIAIIRSRIVSRLAKEGQIRPLPPGTQLPSTRVPTK